MSCAACAVSVESTLKATAGVHDAAVNYANQTAWAVYDESVQPETLQQAVQSAGYDLVIDAEDPEHVQQQASKSTIRS